jgi:hypothetical protein
LTGSMSVTFSRIILLHGVWQLQLISEKRVEMSRLSEFLGPGNSVSMAGLWQGWRNGND